MNSRNNLLNRRSCKFAAVLMAVSFFAAGCAGHSEVVEPRQYQVEVVETETALKVDEKTAAELSLKADYLHAMRLAESGRHDEAVELLVMIAAETEARGVKLAPEMQDNLQLALDGLAPVAAPVLPEKQILLEQVTSEVEPRAVEGPESPRTRPRSTLARGLEDAPREPVPARQTPSRENPAGVEPEKIAAAPLPAPEEPEIYLPSLLDKEMADLEISVDFNQVDIRVVLKTISDITGANFLVDDNVRGTVTLMSPTPIRLAEVFNVLESILEIRGYAAVTSNRIIKIVPRSEAARRNVHTRVGSDPAAIPQTDTVITQIMPLRYVSAAEVAPLVSPRVSAGGNFTSHQPTNTLFITDTSANIHQIARIIREIDVERSQDELMIIPLEHASAHMLSQQITQILTTREGGREAAAKIIPDQRTNSLIVFATGRNADVVGKLVERLDVPRSMEAGNIHVVYLKNADAREMVTSLSAAVDAIGRRDAPEQIRITADEGTNSLVIAASPQDYLVLQDIIAKLDIVREQVLVELRIIEASEEALREIGIDWATLDEAVAGSIRGFGFTNFGLRHQAYTREMGGLGIGFHKEVGGQPVIGAILKALETSSKVNVLSTPHILTSNNQEATILVGENVPYVKESRVTETDLTTPTVIKTYDYKDVGISLRITPHISQDGLVRLAIKSEFSKLIEDTARTAGDTPVTSMRQASTTISVMSGSTVVIGGLMRDDTVRAERRVPLLADIPLLGGLFRWHKNHVQKTNLLLFITPHVLANDSDLQLISELKEAEMMNRIQAPARPKR